MPVTPGQGRDVNAFRRKEITPEITLRWLRGLIRAETLRARGVKPHLVGFSMGGTLVTVVAAEDLGDRVVLLGPFYSLPTADGLIRTAAGLLEPVVPVFPKPWRGNIADPSVYETYQPGTWFISVGAFLNLEELADRARVAATALTRPTLLLGSRKDHAASFQVSQELYAGNEAVTIHEFPNSDHILLYDYDREEVIRMVGEFLSGR
jgi:alpha-beta hydrolase superfamily lysophospholipase